MQKRKHSLPSLDLLYVLFGMMTVVIVLIPITQWALLAIVVDVVLFFHAILRARHTLS